MRKFVIAFMLLGLAACTGVQSSTSGAITGLEARKAVYTAYSAVVAAGQAAVVYSNLPRCVTPAVTVVCSDQAIVDQMSAAYAQANAAAKTAVAYVTENPSGDAQDAVRAANAALSILQGVVLANNPNAMKVN